MKKPRIIIKSFEINDVGYITIITDKKTDEWIKKQL